MKTALNFLVAARQCEIGELEQLQRTSALVDLLSRLIHALQKERGLSNVFLASAGARGGPARLAQMAECDRMAAAARDGFELLDMRPGGAGLTGHPGHGARLFSRIAHVLQCLDALPAAQRAVFLLHHEDGSSVEDLAARLGLGFETAKSRLRYALAKLRGCMQHYLAPSGARW